MHDTVIVGEQVAGESAKTRQQLEAAIQTMNSNVFDVAELLFKVKQGHCYTTTTFQEYLGTLAIKVRKAQYLTRIVEVMHTVGVTRAEYEPLGIAKLREVASLEPGETYTNPIGGQSPMADWVKAFVKDGREQSLDEIKQHVRVLKGLTGPDEMSWLNLPVKRSVKENVILPAFEAARQVLGTKGTDTDGTATEYSDSVCLEAICADFLSGNHE
ncbi:MAG: hypothetical protein ACREQ5_15995 [Candidatus Dormibacteria bacterium]